MKPICFLFALCLASHFATAQVATGIFKVAVVDTGLDLDDPRFASLLCPGESKDFTGTGINDVHGHGTHVTGLIKSYAGKSGYCLMILKYYTEDSTGIENLNHTIEAFQYAVEHGARIVNYSGGGPDGSSDEAKVLLDSPHTLFVTAAGNLSKDITHDEFYPASYDYPNIIAVGSLKRTRDLETCENPVEVHGETKCRSKYSDYGARVKTWELGENIFSTLPCGIRGTVDIPDLGCMGNQTGTSMSTAIHTGRLVHKFIRFSRKH